jgi:hypothetical protein
MSHYAVKVVLGYALYPPTYPGYVMVCPPCFPPHVMASFERTYGADAHGEAYDWTIEDEEPVRCDACTAQIHPGNPVEDDEEWEEEPDATGATDAFGHVYSDADPGL